MVLLCHEDNSGPKECVFILSLLGHLFAMCSVLKLLCNRKYIIGMCFNKLKKSFIFFLMACLEYFASPFVIPHNMLLLLRFSSALLTIENIGERNSANSSKWKAFIWNVPVVNSSDLLFFSVILFLCCLFFFSCWWALCLFYGVHGDRKTLHASFGFPHMHKVFLNSWKLSQLPNCCDLLSGRTGSCLYYLWHLAVNLSILLWPKIHMIRNQSKQSK